MLPVNALAEAKFTRFLYDPLLFTAPVVPFGALVSVEHWSKDAPPVSVISAATADALYGFVAGFGFTFISNRTPCPAASLSHLIGGFFVLPGSQNTAGKTRRTCYPHQTIEHSGCLCLHLSAHTYKHIDDPPFCIHFWRLGLGVDARGYASTGALVSEVFTESAAWWFTLSTDVGLFRKGFEAHSLLWVNRLPNIIITGFGLSALGSLR